MVYPANFEEKIGFNLVRDLIRTRCSSTMGKELVEKISISADEQQIFTRLELVGEFMRLREEGTMLPPDAESDLRPELNRIRTPGTYMTTESLFEFKRSLKIIEDWNAVTRKPFFNKYPALCRLAEGLVRPIDIIQHMERILDEKGEIRDKASEELYRIRSSIKRIIRENEKMIASILVQARKSGWTAPEAEATLRDGRLVIPVIASHKKRIRGLVHDESATGQTVFIEPDSCFEMNNEIKELESAERREIIRILIRFTDDLRPELDDYIAAFDFLARVDLIHAVAKFAGSIHAGIPKLSGQKGIHWHNAVHPLLFLSHQQKNKTVVPLDIELTEEKRILIISGPNAGGKSVCLKTVGLLQYMIQCGIPVPMDPNSQMGVYEDLFIDIGDEQSLENDLSTYSSHLININYLVDRASPETLFLIDEFGAGTDPALGGAIAEAVLEILNGKKAFGVVTTHYSNLKLMSENHPGIINGAMLFDIRKIEPLYQLVTGKPGSSFTLEIAENIGFSPDIIRLAKQKSGKGHLDFEKQLQELEAEKRILAKQKKEFEVADQFLHEMIDHYESKSRTLDEKKNEIIEDAQARAREILEGSNKLIENTIREIRSVKADKEKTRQIRQKVEEQKKLIKDQEEKKENASKSPRDLKKGDWAKIPGQNKAGLVSRIQGKQAQIDFDGIKFTIDLDKLEKTDSPTPQSPEKMFRSKLSGELDSKASNFRLTLDVRGKNVEEALRVVQKYLDDALLLGIKQVNILHGKGDGVLRTVIREYLRNNGNIAEFSDEHIEKGGSGITRVIME